MRSASAVALLFALALTGCGGGDDAPEPTPTPTTQAEAEESPTPTPIADAESSADYSELDRQKVCESIFETNDSFGDAASEAWNVYTPPIDAAPPTEIEKELRAMSLDIVVDTWEMIGGGESALNPGEDVEQVAYDLWLKAQQIQSEIISGNPDPDTSDYWASIEEAQDLCPNSFMGQLATEAATFLWAIDL